MPPKRRKTAAAGRLIGYARVSTEEQGTDPQRDELRAAGCATILEEHASGADCYRLVLAQPHSSVQFRDPMMVRGGRVNQLLAVATKVWRTGVPNTLSLPVVAEDYNPLRKDRRCCLTWPDVSSVPPVPLEG